jgi:hypothetical protein
MREHPTVPIPCPNCDHPAAQVGVSSATVLGLKCNRCDHSWSLDIRTLPGVIRMQIHALQIQMPIPINGPRGTRPE